LTLHRLTLLHCAQLSLSLQVFEGTAPPGMIRVEDLERALTVYGADRLTADQVADLMAQIETNANGMFDYATYTNLMMQE